MAKRRLSYLLSLCLLASGILIIAYLIWSRISLYEIDKRTDFLLVLDIVLLVMLFPLLIYFFLSKQKLAKNNIVLQRLRGKLSHVTENDNIITVQYNVAEQQFIRWNDTTGEPERIFSLDDYWTHIHPDDLPIARKLIEYLHSGNTKEYACEYRYLLPGAETHIWQYNDIYPYETNKQGKAISYFSISRKNDQWHEMHNILERYRKRISFISESIKIYILQYDVASDTFYMLDNKGKNPDIIITTDYVRKIAHPDDLQGLIDLMRQIREHKKKKLTSDFRFIDGKSKKYVWFHNETIAFDYDIDGKICSYLILNINNDNWHETMLEMTELSGKAALLKMISSFLENMGRKVRTPLNAVMGFSDVMSDEESEETRMEYKKIVDENSALMLRMADDMLVLAQIESGNLVFERETFDISRFFDDLKSKICKTLKPGVNIVYLSHNGSFKVKLDPEKLSIITSTILNYFASYSNKGTITVNYSIKDEGLLVAVSDPSFVIEKNSLTHIFDRFDNFDRSSKYIPGIGLPICKALLSNNNGKIIAESDSTQGTIFSFWIPCEISI